MDNLLKSPFWKCVAILFIISMVYLSWNIGKSKDAAVFTTAYAAPASLAELQNRFWTLSDTGDTVYFWNFEADATYDPPRMKLIHVEKFTLAKYEEKYVPPAPTTKE